MGHEKGERRTEYEVEWTPRTKIIMSEQCNMCGEAVTDNLHVLEVTRHTLLTATLSKHTSIRSAKLDNCKRQVCLPCWQKLFGMIEAKRPHEEDEYKPERNP